MVELYTSVSRSQPSTFRDVYHSYHRLPPHELQQASTSQQHLLPATELVVGRHQPSQHNSFYLPPPEEVPLNLSLNQDKSRSSDAPWIDQSRTTHIQQHHLQQEDGGLSSSAVFINNISAVPGDQVVEVGDDTTMLQGVASNIEIAEEPYETYAMPVQTQFGNLVIVSDLQVAKEEVVEAVSNSEDTDEYSLLLQEHDEQLATQKSRNIVLKSKHDELVQKIAKIRSILNSEARRERSDAAGKADEVEVEVKSEGEMDTGDTLPALKRSRNHSWPQMATISSNQRKKEQNKLASKRFRERKKLELAKATGDISALESRNTLLKQKVAEMESEANQIKKILVKLNLIKVIDLPTGQSTIVKI